MKTTKKEKYILIENDGASFIEFTSNITKHHSDFKNENVVIDLHEMKQLKNEELLSFLEISNLHKAEDKSFVIVNNALGMDELPEELIVVPTIQEAEDMVQMDEMQRDLGF